MRRVAGFVLFIILIGVIGAGAWLYTTVDHPYKGYAEAETFVEIPQGAGPASIGRRLVEAGVVRSRSSFRLALWLSRAGRRLQAGEYRFDHPMSPRQVIDKIARGDVYVRAITFPEGLTVKQMAALYETRGFGSTQDFIAASRNIALISGLDPEAPDLEGYLFPDTYTLPRKATAAQLVTRMVASFEKALTPDRKSVRSLRRCTRIVFGSACRSSAIRR